MSLDSKHIMTKQEINISFILSFVYSLRMLGVFLVLPVFFLYSLNLEGASSVLVGISFGIYGLSQSIFQIPFGIFSDKFGRKNIIFIGLGIFALGSFLCALSKNIYFLMFARFVQGSGAVGSVITALLSDLTRDDIRTKAMSIIGSGIALTFSLSLIASPLLTRYIDVSGIFILTGFLVLLAIIIIYYKIPDSSYNSLDILSNKKLLFDVIGNKNLWHLNFGIFVLHCVQMILFTSLPFILENNLGFPRAMHWQLYLPSVILGIIFMIPVIIYSEKKFKLKQSLLLGIIFIIISEITILLCKGKIFNFFISLIFYFTGLNILEAILPSLVSKKSGVYCKGTAIGIYNTFMSIGIFVGGVMGGILQKYFNIESVFYFSIILMLILFLIIYFNANYSKKESKCL